ncbi:MAG: CoA-acylating methylmalonate-semialdehyde dehydrogenase [Myxococcales bacterium]|nr:CoA-acylating methylmalonate-semialdehyde dehydrogenase [Myxococcales bacterium]MCB9540520.1 CoA-acylating methylmalonate-semialdehyde dehydrogenase [Myxococcales bacterium]
MSVPGFHPFTGASDDLVQAGHCNNWIGGELVDARSGARLDVHNPRHGAVMGTVADSDAADVASAVEAAKAAFPGWKATPYKERAQILYRLKALMERDLDRLSWLVSHENGKTFAEGKASVLKGIECLEYGCSLPNMSAGGQIEVSRGVTCKVDYEPLGVVGCVVPFNFPVMVPMWMLPQALVAGNTVVLKPSEQVPFGLLHLAMLAREAGLPDGVLNLVNGRKDAVQAIVDHPDVKAVGFVGSTKVASLLYARGASLGKRMLCLGGAKNHLVVVPDADLELTAQNVAASAFGCAGQRCMAASVLVAVGDADAQVDAVVAEAEKLVLGRDVGAIISEAAVERITGYIDQAEKMGAKVRVDGRGKQVDGKGWWVGPTVLDGVGRDWPAGCDEIFGPVLSIIRVKTLDEAIAIENDNPYGNAACIYTTSGFVAEYATARFEAGMVGVNIGVPVPREPFPFGGWNQSKFGHGDITGMDGFRFWTRARKTTTKWALQSDQNWMS